MAERTAEETPTAQQAGKRRKPEMASQVTGATHPALDVYPPFYLVFHPDRFVVLAGRLVPSLQKFPLEPGVQGVQVEKGGRIRFAAARTRIEEEGRRVVPYEWAPDGESYLQCLDTRPNGGRDIRETWISVFETAHIGARETSPDEEAYAAWLESLVTSGKLPGCPLDVARRMLERATERHQKSLADAAKSGGHGAANLRAKLLAVEVDVLEAAVNAGKTERARAKTKRAPTVDDGKAAS